MICTKCKKKKDSVLFPKYGVRCKECAYQASRDWIKKNPDKVKRYRKEWSERNPEYRYKNQILRNYGLTVEEHKAMAERQKWRCLICEDKEKLVVDHCHQTGKVRGLLCRKCNLVLGYAKDNVKTIENALKYLKSKAV